MGFIDQLRRGLPLLLAVLLIAGALAVPATLALVVDYTDPIVNVFCPDHRLQEEGEVIIGVQKTVVNEGKEHMLPSGFRFALTDTATGETWEAVSGVTGQATFLIQYKLEDAGSHTYHLVEINDGKPGVTYSELLYQIQVDVELTDAIETTVYLDGEETERPVAQFENIYRGEPDLPNTGDPTSLTLYAVLSGLCVLGMAMLLVRARKYVE